MSQVIREVVKEIAAGSSESTAVSLGGLVFGTMQIRRKDGSSVPSGTFQILVNSVQNGGEDDDYFEAAKDASNTEVAAISFSNTSRIFNLPPETIAKRRGKVKLGANVSGVSLEFVFTLYDNA